MYEERILHITTWHINADGNLKKNEHIAFNNQPFQFNYTPIAMSIYDPVIEIACFGTFDDFEEDE